MTTTAWAHPNIALIKYWGKADAHANIPATPSLSLTLDTLLTTTRVRVLDAGPDQLTLDGKPSTDVKIFKCLEHLRSKFNLPPLAIDSTNNFPTAAGLASSASGFAALVSAINTECDLQLPFAALSDHARRASASAARSLLGGWGALRGPQWQAEALPVDWPLEVVIAITQTGAKAVSSSAGMQASADSPFYKGWVDSAEADFSTALAAAQARDFAALAQVCEHSCLKMHGLMLATAPGLVYWQPATVAAIHRVRELRNHGLDVFFSIDAGPQVKAICTPEAGQEVARALAQVPGVLKVERVGLGRAARAERE